MSYQACSDCKNVEWVDKKRARRTSRARCSKCGGPLNWLRFVPGAKMPKKKSGKPKRGSRPSKSRKASGRPISVAPYFVDSDEAKAFFEANRQKDRFPLHRHTVDEEAGEIWSEPYVFHVSRWEHAKRWS